MKRSKDNKIDTSWLSSCTLFFNWNALPVCELQGVSSKYECHPVLLYSVISPIATRHPTKSYWFLLPSVCTYMFPSKGLLLHLALFSSLLLSFCSLLSRIISDSRRKPSPLGIATLVEESLEVLLKAFSGMFTDILGESVIGVPSLRDQALFGNVCQSLSEFTIAVNVVNMDRVQGFRC